MFTEDERAKWRERVARWRNGEQVYDAGKIVEKSDNTSVKKNLFISRSKEILLQKLQLPESMLQKQLVQIQEVLTSVNNLILLNSTQINNIKKPKMTLNAQKE